MRQRKFRRPHFRLHQRCGEAGCHRRVQFHFECVLGLRFVDELPDFDSGKLRPGVDLPNCETHPDGLSNIVRHLLLQNSRMSGLHFLHLRCKRGTMDCHCWKSDEQHAC